MASLPEKSSTLISSSHTRRGERATWMRCVSSCFGCAGAMGGDHGEILVLGGVLLRGLSRSIGECVMHTLPYITCPTHHCAPMDRREQIIDLRPFSTLVAWLAP